jgi:hypothetical protein
LICTINSYGQDTSYQALVSPIVNATNDTFQIKLQKFDIIYTKTSSFYGLQDAVRSKLVNDSNKLFHLDLGQYYEVYNLQFLVYKKQLFILFFLNENGTNYSSLYSFDILSIKKNKNRKIDDKKRHIKFNCCNVLLSSKLDGNILTLNFDNGTFNVDLDNMPVPDYGY